MNSLVADDCFFGSVTVGERGQVVIPADLRKSLGIAPGDRLLVLRHPSSNGLVLAKFEAIQEVISSFQGYIEKLQEQSARTAAEEE